MENEYKEKHKLASSPSLAMISQAVAKFYGGETKHIAGGTLSLSTWFVYQSDGSKIEGVFIYKKRGRFYFSSHF
jgi:hypothetical protein